MMNIFWRYVSNSDMVNTENYLLHKQLTQQWHASSTLFLRKTRCTVQHTRTNIDKTIQNSLLLSQVRTSKIVSLFAQEGPLVHWCLCCLGDMDILQTLTRTGCVLYCRHTVQWIMYVHTHTYILASQVT